MSISDKNWALPQGVQKGWADDTPRPVTNDDLTKKLPTLLRLLGAAALVIAMYSFLAKGWQSGNDVLRYLLMLGHTGLLAAIGLASGHWLKESKGARLLLTLALVSVPANFAILGALIFSQSGALAASGYPQYVAWTVDSLNTALLTSAGAMLVLVPVTLLGFTVLARSMSKKLALLFLASNAALLMPLRDPEMIGLLVLALTACTLFFNRRTAHQHCAAKTSEGITALGLQLLPMAVLMGRSLWLYSVDLFLLSVLVGTLFVMLRQISLFLQPESKTRDVLNALSLIPAAITTLLLANALQEIQMLPQALLIPAGAVVSAMMMYDISLRSMRSSRFYRRLAVGGLLIAMIANMVLFGGLLPALACIIAGLTLLVYGYKAQQRNLFGGGNVLLLAGAGQQLYQVAHHFDLGGWASLAVLGIAAIVTASIMETRGGAVKLRLEGWKKKLQQWEH